MYLDVCAITKGFYLIKLGGIWRKHCFGIPATIHVRHNCTAIHFPSRYTAVVPISVMSLFLSTNRSRTPGMPRVNPLVLLLLAAGLSGAQVDHQAVDLEPRVTIANDMDLKERFTLASRTYSDVREAAEEAVTGHEVADLRLQIAEARWKLDVIDAELDGRPAPPQPHRRDNTGSAWDSTRGTGGGPH